MKLTCALVLASTIASGQSRIFDKVSVSYHDMHHVSCVMSVDIVDCDNASHISNVYYMSQTSYFESL